MKTFKTIKQTILGTKLYKVHSFFDYPAGEKTKLIKQAVRESNKMQEELLNRYDRQFAA